MRALIVNTNWGNGGPGGIAADLYDILSCHGIETYFVYGRGNIPKNIRSYRIGNKLDNYFHALSSRLLDNSGFCSTNATLKFIKFIDKFEPNIISFHNPLGYYLNLELFLNYIRNKGIPLFWTLHDCWTITGHCITGLCDHLKTGCGQCPRLREYPKSILIDNTKNNLARKIKCFSGINNLYIITPSIWLARIIGDTYWNKNRIKVIPNGIDLTVFKPMRSILREKYSLNNKFIVLAVAGSWEPTKGAHYFYKLTRVLDESYAFVMIGSNNDKELKESNKIIHIGRTTDRNELVEWYTAADVLVNPTVGDNFPTVNLEALACGTPVVSFNTGGSGESIGDCGAVVPQKDVEAMASAIRKIRINPLREETCRNRALHYDKKLRYEEYYSYFCEIINCSGV